MSDTYGSGLWNAVDALLAYWSQELTETLEANDPPPREFWETLATDLETAKALAMKARYR